MQVSRSAYFGDSKIAELVSQYIAWSFVYLLLQLLLYHAMYYLLLFITISSQKLFGRFPLREYRNNVYIIYHFTAIVISRTSETGNGES